MNKRNITGHDVISHFNSIAKNYDIYKRRNLFFYYSILKRLIKNNVNVHGDSSILDYGCGTGEILNYLSPKIGVGYDPSIEMVKIASKKFNKKKNLKFVNSISAIKGKFDYIILSDVVEHIPDIYLELKRIKKFMSKSTKLIITFVDSTWDFFPQILERLNLKMPEGPHTRVSVKEMIKTARKVGLYVVKRPSYFLPIKVLILSRPKMG